MAEKDTTNDDGPAIGIHELVVLAYMQLRRGTSLPVWVAWVERLE